MTDKNKKMLALGAVLVLILVIGGFLFMQMGKKTSLSSSASSSVAPQPAVPAEQVSAIDTEEALEERALGNEDAPVKIEEYASMTCNHCAHFYNDTFPELKKKYIDTGKVYFVFSDFPLNAPAMHASMAARCLPQDKYFEFIEMLFAEQDKWGFEPNYMAFLKEKAGEYGLNAPTFDACIQTSEIQQGIVKRMEAAQAQWRISSTPTFVVNNKKIINGAVPFEEFVKVIEEALGNPMSNEEEPLPAAEPAGEAPAATEPAATESEESAAP